VLLVSHDRALLDAIAERTLAIEDHRLEAYDGGWADYVRRRDERAAAQEAPAQKERKEKPKPAAAPRRPRRPRELQQLEAEIEAKEQAVADLERRLADDWADVDAVAAYRRAREELEGLFARWETLVESAQA
jgi:ATPase subunit of ABC transporter with duplicated ATPase domains